MSGRLRWRLGAVTALVAVVASVAAPAGAFVPSPVQYGSAGQVLAEDASSLAAEGLATGTATVLAPALIAVSVGLLYFQSGEADLTKEAQKACAQDIRDHGGFPRFNGYGLIYGSVVPCFATDIITAQMIQPVGLIANEPWQKRFCLAVYVEGSTTIPSFDGRGGVVSGAFTPSWTGMDSWGVGTQAVVDSVCPAAWRPFFQGTGPAPVGTQTTPTTLPGAVAPAPLPGPVVGPVVPGVVLAPGGAQGTGTNGECNVNVFVYVDASGTGNVGYSWACNVPANFWNANNQRMAAKVVPSSDPGNYPGTASVIACNTTAGADGFTGEQAPVYDATQLRISGACVYGSLPSTPTPGTITGWYQTQISDFPGLTSNQNSCTLATAACGIDAKTVHVGVSSTNVLTVPGFPGDYYAGGVPGTTVAVPPGTYTPSQPGTAATPATRGNGSCTGVVDCTLDLGDRVVTQLATSVTGIVNGVVAGVDAGLRQLQTALVWVGNVANTWLADIDAVLRSMAGELTWIGNLITDLRDSVVAAVGQVYGAVMTVDNAVQASADSIVQAVQATSTQVVAAVSALPTQIAAAVSTQLQTLLVPTGTQVQTTMAQVQASVSNTFIGTAVSTVTDVGGSMTTAMGRGLHGSACGPSLGFDAFSVAGQSIPGWRVYLPSAPGCPGNGPGGSQTSQDAQGYDLLGYRDLVRGMASFCLLYGFVWSLIRSAPWSDRSDKLASTLERMGGGASDRLGVGGRRG